MQAETMEKLEQAKKREVAAWNEYMSAHTDRLTCEHIAMNEWRALLDQANTPPTDGDKL